MANGRRSTASQLPSETLLGIYQYLTGDDLLNLVEVTRPEPELSTWTLAAWDSQLWRAKVRETWTYGSDKSSSSSEEEGVQTYLRRRRVDREARHTLDQIIDSPNGIIPLVESLARQGASVYDALLPLVSVSEQARPRDYLCVRYWAQKSLAASRRRAAVHAWLRIADANTDTVDPEDEPGDLFEDGILALGEFRNKPEHFSTHLAKAIYDEAVKSYVDGKSEGSTPREIAADLVALMRSIGVRPAAREDYHNLNNHFVNLVLTPPHRGRGTLPITLISVFCSLARRLPASWRFEARPIGYPGTVMVAYRRRGPISSSGGGTDWAYLDLYHNFDSLQMEDVASLRTSLASLGFREPAMSNVLRPARAREMVERACRNIMASIEIDGMGRNSEGDSPSLYGACYAVFAFVRTQADRDRMADIPRMLATLIQAEYAEDVGLLELVSRRARYDGMRQICDSIRAVDVEDSSPKSREIPLEDEVYEQPPSTTTRPARRQAQVAYGVGTVFWHRTNGYLGVIRGFDSQCMASAMWQSQMGVRALARAGAQPFYDCIDHNGEFRYVAEDNIGLSLPPEAHELVRTLKTSARHVGRYFLRGDEQGFVPSALTRAAYE